MQTSSTKSSGKKKVAAKKASVEKVSVAFAEDFASDQLDQFADRIVEDLAQLHAAYLELEGELQCPFGERAESAMKAAREALESIYEDLAVARHIVTAMTKGGE